MDAIVLYAAKSKTGQYRCVEAVDVDDARDHLSGFAVKVKERRVSHEVFHSQMFDQELKREIYEGRLCLGFSGKETLGNVYVLQAIEEPTLFKVGCTSGKVSKRLRTLQTGSPYTLRVFLTFQSDRMFDLETQIHNQLRSFHLRGEWFQVWPETLTDLVDNLDQYNGAFWNE